MDHCNELLVSFEKNSSVLFFIEYIFKTIWPEELIHEQILINISSFFRHTRTSSHWDRSPKIFPIIFKYWNILEFFSGKYKIFNHTPTVIRINPNFLGAQAEMAVRGSTAPRTLGLIKQTWPWRRDFFKNEQYTNTPGKNGTFPLSRKRWRPFRK